jgi:hypothetical protein
MRHSSDFGIEPARKPAIATEAVDSFETRSSRLVAAVAGRGLGNLDPHRTVAGTPWLLQGLHIACRAS